MNEKDAVEVMKRNRKLVRDGNVAVDNAKVEAETLIAKSKALVAEHARSQAAQGLLEILPQGHGSGLDADMVDGLHAAEIISKAAIRGSGGGGGGSNGNATKIQDKDVDIAARVDDTILVFKSISDSYIHETKGAPGAHASTHQNGGGDEVNVAGLSGELADPQPPKAHNQALGTITGHDKAAHDALGINADLVDSCHAGLMANNVFKILAAIATGDIFYIDATPQITRLPKGSDGQVLKLVSGLPAWQTEGGGTNHDILSATHTDSLAASVVRGDIIIGNSTPKWARLAKGAQYAALRMGANDPAWALITNNNIDAAAAIAESKLALNYATHALLHAASHNLAGADELNHDNLAGFVAAEHLSLPNSIANVLSDHNKAVHDALDIDADTVDGAHLSELATDAELAAHAALESVHHTKFTITEHDVTERHALGTIVPHDALASLTEKSHVNLTDKGTNTHPQIDTHLTAAAPHSGHEAIANKDQANGYAGLSASTKLAAGQMPTGKVKTTLSFAVTGTLVVGTDKAPTLLAPCTLTITKVKLVVKTAPTGAAIIVDVNKNDTTIFTTQSNRPQIAIGATTGDSGTPDVTSLAEGDKITIDVDAVGSSEPGKDLTIEIICEQLVVFS